MEIKTCFKCKKEKPLTEFYKHPAMGDGHLGKCKECTRLDTKKRDERRKENEPDYWEKERRRGRNKYHRLYEGTGKAKPENNRRWEAKFPEKKRASSACGQLKKIKPFDGAETHHWSYLQEHWKDIIWLSKKDHKKAHRFIIYDQEQKQYRRIDTMELLDDKQRHEEYIRFVIKNKED